MARPLKPLIRGGGGFYPSKRWTPLVYQGGYTTPDGGGESGDPLNTFTGKIVQFLSSAVKPIVELVANLVPSQDLHGYDNPWPEGGGVNKAYFDPADITGTGWLSYDSQTGKFTITVGGSGASPNPIPLINPIQSGTEISVSVFVESGQFTSGVISIGGYHNDNPTSWQGQINIPKDTNLAGKVYTTTTTTTADLDSLEIFIYGNPTITSNIVFRVQIELGSTPTVWHPLTNICPISGHTGVTVYRTGVNLFDKSNVSVLQAYIASASEKILESSSHRTLYIPCEPDTTYTAQKIAVENGEDDRFTFGYCNELPVIGSSVYGIVKKQSGFVIGEKVSLTLTTGANAKYLVLWVAQSVDYTDSIATTEIELGSTASPYEPHVGNTYPITFPAEAGTVYGGTLQVNEDGSGALTVTMIGITVDTTQVGKENDGWNNNGLNVFWVSISSYGKGKYIYTDVVPNILANMCVTTSYNGLRNTGDLNKIAFTGQGNYLEWTSPSTTLNDEKTRLTNTPMQVVYELATPVTVPLTAEQINTLQGNNVVWVDDSDNISVTAYGTEVS